MKDRMCIAYEWRLYWVMIGFLVIEIPLTIAVLVLFGIADGDTYRTKLWQNGYDQGFNSAPSSILYSYANHDTPHWPLVWSSYTTEFNIVISVLSMFILLTKSVMYLLHAFIPILSVFVHALLVALWSVSLYNQAQPDHSDPDLGQNLSLPWYLSKGCGYAAPKNHGYCLQARSSFAVTCVMLALFAFNLLWSLYNLPPTASERAERTSHRDIAIELKTALPIDEEEAYEADSKRKSRRRATGTRSTAARFNLDNIPKTPQTATRNLMTPRTKAFSVLNGASTTGGEASAVGREGPLPSAMKKNNKQNGDGVAQISTGVGPSRPLAFREQYNTDGSRGNGDGQVS